MKINSVFDKTVSILERSLDVRARKHELILSNVANADTPNYKAVELEVEQELSDDFNSYRSNSLAITHPFHFSIKNDIGMGIRTSKLDVSKEVTLRGDGNTVNIEKEMAELTENNLMYRATADILAKKFQGIIKAIQGGRR